MTSSHPVDRSVVQRNFARHATEYERHARVQGRVARRLAALLAELERPAGPLLEVGCGTGFLSRLLSPLCGDESLILSDLAHPMTCQAAAVLPRATALDADAEALPLAAGSCALLASASVYQWLNALPAALAEAARVLKPGGILALALFGGRTLYELRDAHRQAVRESGASRLSHALDFPTLDELAAALAGCGLTVLQLFSEEEEELHGEVAELLRALKGIGAANAASDRPGGLARRDVMLRMQEIYRLRYGRSGQIPATYEVLYLLARKG